jgi:multicomponent K+:H+ antiporter subunit D
MLSVSYEAFGVRDTIDPHDTEDEVGVAIPAAMAFMGLAFVCCVLLVAGLPPLAGFLAKFALLSALFGTDGLTNLSGEAWALLGALLATGLAGVISLTRIGVRLFWTISERTTPRLRLVEAGPVAFLLVLCVGLTFAARPVMTYLESAAGTLHDSQSYIHAVLGVQPAPSLQGSP